MSKETDNKILRFMEGELTRGHFEHTIREISQGTNLSYNNVSKGVERLKIRRLIAFRSRGSNNRPIPYYYLSELREIIGNREKKLRNVGKTSTKAKAKKQNQDIPAKGEW